MMSRIYACGTMGLPLAALGVAGAILALVCIGAIIRTRRAVPLLATGIAAVALGAITLAMGPVGASLRRAAAEQVVAGDPLLDAEQRAEYRQRAAQWAAQCIPLGSAGGAAPLLAGGAAIVAGVRRRKAKEGSNRSR